MSVMHRAVTGLLLAVIPVVAYGQMDDVEPTILLSGRLTDANHSPVANATVVLASATGGSILSTMRTAQNGRFAFQAAPNMAYGLTFAAPGFAALTVAVKTADKWLELPDTVLRLGSAAAVTAEADRTISRATLPADLLELMKNDFGLRDIQKCLQDEGETFEQTIRTTWLTLTTDNNEALLVEGLGPCLAGANNGALLVYGRFGTGWRKILDVTGSRIETLRNRTQGFLDLARWQHGSAFDSVEFVYQFNGHDYKAVRCTSFEFADPPTGTAHTTPKREPCTWDWKAAERQ